MANNRYCSVGGYALRMNKFINKMALWGLLFSMAFTGCSGVASGEPVSAVAAVIENSSDYKKALETENKENPEKENTEQEENAQPETPVPLKEEGEKEPEQEPEKKTFDPSLKPNEVGNVLIIMYHHIVEYDTNKNLERSAKDFRSDLEGLYDEGYRLTSMESLIQNKIEVEPGKSPVVLTFDDGWSTAFSLEETEEGLEPKKNTAVEIINTFCDERPDFGKAAIFYINGYQGAFSGAGNLSERFQYLIENGYEIGNHTYSHSNLSKLNAEGIQNEIVSLDLFVKDILPDYQMTSFCYPYGVRPKEELRPLALKGEFQGKTYEYKWALREGPTKNSAAPNSIKFDPLNVPRVRGTNNEEMDLWWFLDYYKANPQLKYISDGEPDVISVPLDRENLVNKESIGEKTLNIY